MPWCVEEMDPFGNFPKRMSFLGGPRLRSLCMGNPICMEMPICWSVGDPRP